MFNPWVAYTHTQTLSAERCEFRIALRSNIPQLSLNATLGRISVNSRIGPRVEWAPPGRLR